MLRKISLSRLIFSPEFATTEWTCFSPKCFSGHVECSFDKPADDFLSKVQKFSLKVPKNYLFWKNFFISKMSSGHVKCSFDNTAEKIWLRVRIFFTECPKKFWFVFSLFFFRPKRSSEQVECNSVNPANFFLLQTQIILFIFPTMFLWTGRMHFRQHWRNSISEWLCFLGALLNISRVIFHIETRRPNKFSAIRQNLT